MQFMGTLLRYITFVLLISSSRADPPGEPFLAVPRAGEAPVIDGALDDAAWKTAACQPFLFDKRSFRPVDEGTRTRSFLSWDDEKLYVGFEASEPNPDGLMLRRTGRDFGSLDDDDTVWFWIQAPDANAYYRFCVSSGGFIFDEQGMNSEWNADLESAAEVGADAWKAEFSIPWAAIGGPPQPEQVWRANFTRHRIVGPPKFSEWSNSGPAARAPHLFGYLRFVDSAPAIRELKLGTDLPGRNRLTARVAAPDDGSSLRVRHADGDDGVAVLGLPQGAGRNVTLDYPITTRTPGKLVVELAGGEEVYLRLPIKTSLEPTIRADHINESLVLLAGMAAEPGNETLWAALEDLRSRGEAALASADEVIAAAHRAGKSVPQGTWREVAAPVLEFQEVTRQPVIWTQHALARSFPATVPAKIGRLDKIEIAAAVNELEAAALLVRSVFFDDDVDLRIELGEVERIEGERENPLRRSHIRIAEALMIPTRAHGVTADPVSTLGNAGVFHLPVSETREIWFEADTAGLSPGLYRIPVQIHPLDYEAGILVTSFVLEVRVWDFELPDEIPIAVYNFDYTRGLSGNHDYAEDQRRARTSVFHVTNIPVAEEDGSADFSVLDDRLARLPDNAQAFMEVWFMRAGGWKDNFGPWVRSLAAYMQSQGLDYDRWFLHIFDESASDDFLECATKVKEADPRVRISSTHMAHDAERQRLFVPVIDIWMPIYRALDRPELAIMKESGKPVWTYDCGTTPMFSTTRHRFLPWRAWRYDLDGVTLWTYSQNNWNDPPYEHNFGQFFGSSHGGTVPSKRWIAWREGLEDYLYLVRYEEELAKRGGPAEEDEALLALARECGAEDPPGIERYYEVREAIAARILELRP